MSCYHPRKMYKTKNDQYVFDKPTGHSGQHIKIPCKLCVGCRLDYTATWATRMMHESSFYPENWFGTMTYNDENIPEDGGVNLRDVQLLHKKLRRQLEPDKMRFVVSSEYGSQTLRPHYHGAYFNARIAEKFGDLEMHSKSKDGSPLYVSEKFSNIWGNGFTLIGQLTRQSAAYVASYMLKDLDGDYVGANYSCFNPKTGEVSRPTNPTNLKPNQVEQYKEKRFQEENRIYLPKPFITMSRKPGIGKDWYKKYMQTDVLNKGIDQLHLHDSKGNRLNVPSYYFEQLKIDDLELYEAIKDLKADYAMSKKFMEDNTKQRLETKEKVKMAQIKQGQRGISDGQ